VPSIDQNLIKLVFLSCWKVWCAIRKRHSYADYACSYRDCHK